MADRETGLALKSAARGVRRAIATGAFVANARLHGCGLPVWTKDYRKFVVSAPGRSGSTMLIERCNSHPAVECFGELMHKQRIFWHRRHVNGEDALFAERERDPLAFLERYAFYPRKAAVRAVGFKLLHDQLNVNRSVLAPLLSDPAGLKVIALERRNGFESYLSSKNIERSGIGSVRDKRRIPSLPPLYVDVEQCHAYLKRLAVSKAIADTTFQHHDRLKVVYEDLVAEPEFWNTQICEFLGVPSHPLTHFSVKLTHQPLDRRVANYVEVERYFRNTEWEPCFV